MAYSRKGKGASAKAIQCTGDKGTMTKPHSLRKQSSAMKRAGKHSAFKRGA